MNSYPYDLGKKQLEQKLKTTINENDFIFVIKLLKLYFQI